MELPGTEEPAARSAQQAPAARRLNAFVAAYAASAIRRGSLPGNFHNRGNMGLAKADFILKYVVKAR